MATVNDNDLFHPARRERQVSRCATNCPLGVDSFSRRAAELIKGRTFDLRTADGLYEGLERLLRAAGASVIVG